MKTSDRTQISAPFDPPRQRGPLYLSGFQATPPRFRTPQNELQDWLLDAHLRTAGADKASMEALFSRYSASADRIAYRGHELADFTHRRWDEMRLFGPRGSDLAQKMTFFDESVMDIFERLYAADATAPQAIVHVTCTGYSAPSGAQRLVSTRGWGRRTQVVHAYHMGCYAAHPAIRIAVSLGTADVVHTELCSLHLDPAKHHPEQLVIQSLFADGFIKYQVSTGDAEDSPNLEILAARDEILPDSTQAMRWGTGPFTFTMGLSKEVPTLLASALPRFAVSLFEEAGFDFTTEKPRAFFAIHPGGPRIIELSERILGLEPTQTVWSREVLRDHGNMSSATLPHIWQRVLQDARIPDRAMVLSIGAGPGLTLSGMLFRKRMSEKSNED